MKLYWKKYCTINRNIYWKNNARSIGKLFEVLLKKYWKIYWNIYRIGKSIERSIRKLLEVLLEKIYREIHWKSYRKIYWKIFCFFLCSWNSLETLWTQRFLLDRWRLKETVNRGVLICFLFFIGKKTFCKKTNWIADYIETVLGVESTDSLTVIRVRAGIMKEHGARSSLASSLLNLILFSWIFFFFL